MKQCFSTWVPRNPEVPPKYVYDLLIFPSFLVSSRNSRENSSRTLLATYFGNLKKFPFSSRMLNYQEEISCLEIRDLNLIFPVSIPENGNGKIKKLSTIIFTVFLLIVCSSYQMPCCPGLFERRLMLTIFK